MGETCEVCGMEKSDVPDGVVCTYPIRHDGGRHWRLGYERQKARAEKAEAELAQVKVACAQASINAGDRVDALAAALREARDGLDAGLEMEHVERAIRRGAALGGKEA